MISEGCINCGGKEFTTQVNAKGQTERICKTCSWISIFMFRERIQVPVTEEQAFAERY